MRTVGLSKIGLLVSALLAIGAAESGAQKAGAKGKGQASAAQSDGIYSTKPEVAEAAAIALGKSKSPKAVGTLLDALAMGLHPRVAAAALDGLAVHSKQESFDIVAYYTNHRNAKVRSAGLKVMGTLSDKRANARVLDALSDGHKSVRATAANILAAKKNKQAIEPLVKLLQKGDEAAASAIAALADADLARNLGELIGSAPDGLLARCLGGILMRPDFKPDEARVEIVKALGKIPGNDSLEQLTNYVGSIPEKPPRESRGEAEKIIEARLGG